MTNRPFRIVWLQQVWPKWQIVIPKEARKILELETWTELSKSLEIWFEKSWSAIWDSNITWIIISVILYVFGINMIKWFGLTLWVWLVISLFSAMYVSRLFVVLISKCKKLSIKSFIWFKE